MSNSRGIEIKNRTFRPRGPSSAVTLCEPRPKPSVLDSYATRIAHQSPPLEVNVYVCAGLCVCVRACVRPSCVCTYVHVCACACELSPMYTLSSKTSP